MEAIIWIAAAIIVYFTGTGKKQGQGKERKEKVYLGCSLFAALCCEFAIKVVFHIHYLSIWLILTYALIAAQCSRMLWIFICIPEKRKQVYSMSIKMAVGMGILAFYYVNLSRDVIGVTKIANQFPPVSTGMADLMLLAATAIWIYGTDVLRRFPECARAIYWIFLAITPFLAFFLEELCWNPSVTGISLLNGELNVLIYLILEVIFVCLMQKGTLGLQALYIFAWLVGALNYYLLKFRGQPFLATDIFALRTAMSVAGQYTFEVAEELAFTFLILYFLFTCMWALGKMEIFQKRTGKKRILIKGCGAIGAAAALFFWIGSYDFPDTYNIWIDFWAQVNTYQTTGFAPAFISFWQRMKISKPDGYTEQSAEQIFDEYGAVEAPAETEKKDTGEQPMIITIMNESFSDLSVLGPLACTEDDLLFFH